MTNQEAISVLESINAKTDYFLNDDVRAEAIETAISALQEQIPKKPTVPVDTWLCPSCGEPVEYQQKLGDNVLYHGQHDFCPKCGQAIDWEEA